MIQLTEHQPEAIRIARREIAAASFIPYACHYDDSTLLTKSVDLLQILRIEGFSSENADFDEIDFKKNLRNVLFKSIANPCYALWFHTVRQRQPAFPAGTFEPGFANDLNIRWKKKNQGSRLFENTLYISLLRQGQGGKVYGFRKFLDALSRGTDQSQRNAWVQQSARELTDVRRRFEAALADYGPRVLTIRRTPLGSVSEPLAFLSRLLNLEERPVRVAPSNISQYLSTKRLFFGPNALESRGASASKLAAMISIKEYGAETAPGMLDRFFQLPFEWVITQSFVFSHRQEALSKMQKQQRLLETSGDPALSQRDQIGQALDDAMSGETAFGDHHMTVMPIARSLEDLNKAVAAVESELMNLGIMAVREDLNMEPCFWAQLPGNASYIARRSTISTANLAGFVSLHNFPSGRLTDNHWGPAVTLLETQSGTPYYFNFHLADVGHTLLIGPTGSGKTVLLNFLCAQARKFRCRLFFFDKDRGAEIFLRALGGSYSILGGGVDSGFNPLQLPDNPGNRAFLSEWLQSLTTAWKESFSSQDMTVVSQAVTGNFKLAQEDRTMAKIAPFLGLQSPGTLGGRLALWHSDGPHRNLFGNDRDMLSLNQDVMGFEMGPILADRESLGPVLMYLFHRIQMVLDGTPTMIVLDEAWALLDNPLFAPKIKDWLKTLRKLNAFVVFATQSVEDASKSSISDTLVQQSATQIYFPNAKATESYRTVFKLSDRELEFIQNADPSSRSFLIKQGRDAVAARLDLSDMPDVLSVLSGRAETVLKCQEARARVGDDPAAWLPLFFGGIP